MDHGYLEALHDVRMKLFKSHALEVIAPDRIRVGSGEQLPANVIILANGFETQQIVPMTIQGVYGARLPDLWQQGSQAAAAYMGYVAVLLYRQLPMADTQAALVCPWRTSQTSFSLRARILYRLAILHL